MGLRLGWISAAGVAGLSALYAGTAALGLASLPSPEVPIQDPYFTVLTLGNHPDLAHLPGLQRMLAFQWPSPVYALDILAWDFFFPLSVLFAAPTFRGPGLPGAIRRLLGLSGVLALAGLAGVPLERMEVRNIGIVGYAVVFPMAAVLLGVHFRRTGPAGRKDSTPTQP